MARERSLASGREHYYEPPQIERGWRHHLADTDGRVYLGMVNNVTILGHAHPGSRRRSPGSCGG